MDSRLDMELLVQTTITASYLAKHLSDVLDRVRNQGEEFLIEQDGETIAKLSGVAAPRGITLAELARLLSSIPPPDDKFADDLEAVHAAQPPMPEPPHWPC